MIFLKTVLWNINKIQENVCKHFFKMYFYFGYSGISLLCVFLMERISLWRNFINSSLPVNRLKINNTNFYTLPSGETNISIFNSTTVRPERSQRSSFQEILLSPRKLSLREIFQHVLWTRRLSGNILCSFFSHVQNNQVSL